MTNLPKGMLTIEFHQFEGTLHGHDINLFLGKTDSELRNSSMTKETGSWH